MRFTFPLAALVGACLIAAPAQAAPVGAIKDFVLPAQFGSSAPIIKVQRVMNPVVGPQRAGSGQRGGGGQRMGGGGGHRGGSGGGGGYRGGHGGGGDDGGAVAAGVIGGLLLGAIIANEAQRGNAVDNCARRFRSYDRRSQTYVGAGGQRYSCP